MYPKHLSLSRPVKAISISQTVVDVHHPVEAFVEMHRRGDHEIAIAPPYILDLVPDLYEPLLFLNFEAIVDNPESTRVGQDCEGGVLWKLLDIRSSRCVFFEVLEPRSLLTPPLLRIAYGPATLRHDKSYAPIFTTISHGLYAFKLAVCDGKVLRMMHRGSHLPDDIHHFRLHHNLFFEKRKILVRNIINSSKVVTFPRKVYLKVLYQIYPNIFFELDQIPIRPAESKFHEPDEKNGGLRKHVLQKSCVVCKYKTVFFCIGCSHDDIGCMAHICSPRRDKGRGWGKSSWNSKIHSQG